MARAKTTISYIVSVISLAFVAISCYGIYVADDPYKSDICKIINNNNSSYTVNLTNALVTAYGHEGFQNGEEYMCVIVDEIVVLTEKKYPIVFIQIVLGITAFVYFTIFAVNFTSISMRLYRKCVYSKSEIQYLTVVE